RVNHERAGQGASAYITLKIVQNSWRTVREQLHRGGGGGGAARCGQGARRRAEQTADHRHRDGGRGALAATGATELRELTELHARLPSSCVVLWVALPVAVLPYRTPAGDRNSSSEPVV
ncbi:hypothetical protein AB0A99_12390, partial [Streptomyces fradiae]